MILALLYFFNTLTRNSRPWHKDNTQKIVSQCISSADPNPLFLRSRTPPVTAHKRLPRRLPEPIFLDSLTIAAATNEFDSGPRTVTGDTENSTSVNRPREALSPEFIRKAQSRVPLQTETQAQPISKTVVPSRRIHPTSHFRSSYSCGPPTYGDESSCSPVWEKRKPPLPMLEAD